jgi:hypothetical protein
VEVSWIDARLMQNGQARVFLPKQNGKKQQEEPNRGNTRGVINGILINVIIKK